MVSGPADNSRPDDASLIALCAVARQFTADMFWTLAGVSPERFAGLVARSDVVRATKPGAYMLRDEARAAALDRLRSERPLDELALHTRSFGYFLGRLEQSLEASSQFDEDECLFHLDRLFSLLSQRMEWQTIERLVGSVRAAGLQQPRHLERLLLYEGYTAVRTQQYNRGEAILTDLLGQSELYGDVRLNALNALAQVYSYQTQYDRALHGYRRLLAAARELDSQVYQALALLNMGAIYDELEQYEQALELSQQSVGMFQAAGERVREAYALYAVGRDAMYLGRWQLAQASFDQAIGLFEAMQIQAGLAALYWGQGYMQHVLGDEALSEAAYLRALPLAQSAEFGQPTAEMDVYLHLGFLYQTQGRLDDAINCLDRAAQLATRLGYAHRSCQIDYQRGQVFKLRGDAEAAFVAYARSIATIEALRGATEGETVKIGLLGTTQQVYEAMVLLCLELGRPAEAFDYVERARSQAFLDTLVQKSPELYDALDQPVATLAELQARLPDDALLLEFFTTGVLPRGEHLVNLLPAHNRRLREHLALPPNVLIFAVTRERLEVHRPALDPNTLRPQAGDPGPGRRLLRERMLSLLYERLVGPAAHLLAGRSLLYLVPHGPLHYVPFTALRAPSGPYLIDLAGPAVALAPSATVLLRNCIDRPVGRGDTFLALGYDDPHDAGLRYAEREARLLAQLMGGAAWVGSAPKRQRLLSEGAWARWLHIAGHAIFNPDDPLGSELRLGPDESLSARAIMGGLELAGELVTLSACTSGLSHVVPGDELLGLQRAFLYAGAPTIVCTLWEAADLVAMLLMEQFYGRLRQGHSPAAALRDAQVAVRTMTGRDLAATVARWQADDPGARVSRELPAVPPEQLDVALFADPFYWAPFMLIGRA